MRRDIYVHDVGTGETTLVSGGVPGAGTVNRSATEPTISADGSLIAPRASVPTPTR